MPRPLLTVYLPAAPADDGTHYRVWHHDLQREVTIDETGDLYAEFAHLIERIFDQPAEPPRPGTARLVKDNLSFSNGHAALYLLDPPLNGHVHVVVSAVDDLFSYEETLIFPSDKRGNVIDCLALPGSYRGGLDHGEALRGAGYEVTP